MSSPLRLTGRRPATMPNVIRLNPRAHLQHALGYTKSEMEEALLDLTVEVEDVFRDMRLKLDYSVLHHTEEEVMLFGEFLLSLGMTEMAVDLLSAWATNPYR